MTKDETKNRKTSSQENAACINFVADYLVSSRQIYSQNNSAEMTSILSASLKEKFDLTLSDKQIKLYISKARERIEEFAKLNKKQKSVWYISYLMELLDCLHKAGDYKSELPVLKEIASVESLIPDKNDRELQYKAFFESEVPKLMNLEQLLRVRNGEEPVNVLAEY